MIIFGDFMVVSISPNRCVYPGCTIVFGGPKRQYCAKHSQLLLEAANKKAPPPVTPPMPTPPAPPPRPPQSAPTPDTASPAAKRVRSSGHRKQVEMMKRKIAKRAKPP